MKTDNLIELLAQDTQIGWTLTNRVMVALAGGAAIATALFALSIGVRPDIAVVAQTSRFLFKFAFAFALLCSASAAVVQVGRPETNPRTLIRSLAALSIPIGAAVGVELIVTPESSWMSRWIGQNAAFCLVVIPALAILPLACLLYALRGSAPSQPGIAGAVAGLAASGIAATLYATHCPDDSPLFVATWYSLATVVVVGAGSLLGARLLRW